MRMLCLLCCCLLNTLSHAERIVNIYLWGGEIPAQVIQQFSATTGIKVNVSTYDNNETLLAKLSTQRQAVYDVILPSAYFVERMRRHGLLEPLDKTQLSHYSNLSAQFTNNAYDPNNQYSIPLIWGATGIVINTHYIQSAPKTWRELWSAQFANQLMLLDDVRDVFGMALLSLHYSPNDRSPTHLAQAYQQLLALKNNIKLFASEGIQALLIDEDVLIAAAWNGDALKAQQENPAIEFIYPDDGFVIWVDCLAIPKHPPHPQEAYAFINFILQAEHAAEIAMITGHATTNQAALALLPAALRNNRLIYPDKETLKRGFMQRDVPDDVLDLYNHDWQALKLAF
jgi:spermidine/putrescine transport system substrate-binding protein